MTVQAVGMTIQAAGIIIQAVGMTVQAVGITIQAVGITIQAVGATLVVALMAGTNGAGTRPGRAQGRAPTLPTSPKIIYT